MKIFATLRIEKDKRIIHVANLNSTLNGHLRQGCNEGTTVAGEFHPLRKQRLAQGNLEYDLKLI